MNENLKNLYEKAEALFNRIIADTVKGTTFRAWAKTHPSECDMLNVTAEFVDSCFTYINEQDEKIDQIMKTLDTMDRKLDSLL